MAVFVVAGMHGSGTSLAARILHDGMGIQMHPNLNGRVLQYQTYEDAKFMRLNIQILTLARGEWKNPPSRTRILEIAQGPEVVKRILSITEERAQGNLTWGWKDPRNCLTAEVYHNYLTEPRYIRVVRNYDGIASSMLRRGGKSTRGRWVRLAKVYYERLDRFLATVTSPTLTVHFEELTSERKAGSVVYEIAKFAGVKYAGVVEKSLAAIKYR